MADTLHITDGTTTIDIDDPTSSYSLKWGGWAPQVARVNYRGLGNVPIVEDVDEELVLTIKGASADAVMANLEALVGLIYKAERWWTQGQEHTIDPVEIVYEISDSTLSAPLRAYIIGSPERGAIIDHPSHFDALEDGLYLSPVTLRFRRHGLWRGSTDAKATSALSQQTLAEVTFTESFLIPCPYDITIDLGVVGTTPMKDSMLVISETDDAENMVYKDGTVGSKLSSGNSYASQADSANDARGGSVGRITASSTVQTDVGFDCNITQRLLAIFAVVRVNDAARTWTLDAYSITTSAQENTTTRPKIILAGADGLSPRVVFLGYVIAPTAEAGHGTVVIEAVVDAITGSPTFDIDCVLMLGMDEPNSRSITIMPPPEADLVNDIYLVALDDDKSPRPLIYVFNSEAEYIYLGWRGDAYLCSEGNKLTAMLLTTRDSAWVWTDSSDNPYTFTWTFTRTRGYLTPK